MKRLLPLLLALVLVITAIVLVDQTNRLSFSLFFSRA